MKCKKCAKPIKANEHFAFNGRCEECWSGKFHAVITRRVMFANIRTQGRRVIKKKTSEET